ncbi:hypothetical protein [Streptomyces sp. NBC_00096]|uniref:hypothetical protein n=1 Tax=Streptomyces sp. NBC_00096 TaxID=2975650 RepID=UPI003255183E
MNASATSATSTSATSATASSPAEPRWSDVASRTQIGMFRAVWGVGALAAIASALLVVGGFSANRMAGESGQPAAVLGLIGLCLSGTVLTVGMLARFVVLKTARR